MIMVKTILKTVRRINVLNNSGDFTRRGRWVDLKLELLLNSGIRDCIIPEIQKKLIPLVIKSIRCQSPISLIER
jgi:hypothetical protein